MMFNLRELNEVRHKSGQVSKIVKQLAVERVKIKYKKSPGCENYLTLIEWYIHDGKVIASFEYYGSYTGTETFEFEIEEINALLIVTA